MGTLNLERETYHRQKITQALQRRGMIPDTEEDWEIHGPHSPEMPYQVYVGYAISKSDKTDCPCVVITPHAVYEIETPADWGKTSPEQRIAVLKGDQ